MNESEILERFTEIQDQLANERRARLHAWFPRSLVILAFAVFAVVWAQGLEVQEQQEADRKARRIEICEAINVNRVLVGDVLNDVIAVAGAGADPKVVTLLENYEDRLAPDDCSDPFEPSSGD